MLEQIKVGLADNYKFKFQNWNYNRILNEFDIEQSFEDGFDDCMNLELPIKFAEWRDVNGKDIIENDSNNIVSLKELFNYWINNVYGK